MIRLLDGTKAYLHGVIDKFSRRILAWRVNDRFEVASTVILLNEAAQTSIGEKAVRKLLADGGVENMNANVDALVESGLIKRVLAQTDVAFSNSMIVSWWRILKHNWLFMNALDSVATVRRLTAFHIAEPNSVMPLSAFSGQTPDEMYFGTGDEVSVTLEAERIEPRARRQEPSERDRQGRAWASDPPEETRSIVETVTGRVDDTSGSRPAEGLPDIRTANAHMSWQRARTRPLGHLSLVNDA